MPQLRDRNALTRYEKCYQALHQEPWLSLNDVAVKIGCDPKTLRNTLASKGTNGRRMREDIIRGYMKRAALVAA